MLTDADESENLLSGKIGSRLTWTLNKISGELKIDGNGEMPSFGSAGSPWKDNTQHIYKVFIGEGITSISDGNLNGLDRIIEIHIPSTLVKYKDSAFYWDEFVEYPFFASVYSSDIESWLSIDFLAEDNWGEIGKPFDYAENLYFGEKLADEVVIPETVNVVKRLAFAGFECIESVIIPSSLIIIGDYAFNGCSNIKELELNEGLLLIDRAAFAGCSELKKVIIPSTVCEIEQEAFGSCSNLCEVEFALDENNFSSIRKIGSGWSYYRDFYRCPIEHFIIPASVEEIRYVSPKVKDITVYNPNCVFADDCGINYQMIVYGFKGSTAEFLADEVGAQFIDIESVHTHDYKIVKEKGYYPYERCLCGKSASKSNHIDLDCNALCDSCNISVNDIEINIPLSVVFNGYEDNYFGFTATKKGIYTFKVNGFFSGSMTLYDGEKKVWLGSSKNNELLVKNLDVGERVCLYIAQDDAPDVKELLLTYEEALECSHSYNKYDSVTPSCWREGKATYICTICGDTYTETIAKLEHQYRPWETKNNPTCTAAGLEWSYCLICDNDFEREIPATGHTVIDYTRRATPDSDGAYVTACDVCNEEFKSVSFGRPAEYKLSTTTYTYNGKAKTPKLTVTTSDGKVLKKGVDYTVELPKDHTSVGTHTYRVVFMGDYLGETKVSYQILPGKTSSVSASQSTDYIKLTWKKVTGATGYRVYQYNSSTGKYKTLKTLTGTSYTVKNLKAGTTYKFAVKAYTMADGETLWAASSKTLTTATKPATPTVKATAGSGKATLSWSKVTGATGYVVYMMDEFGDYVKVGSTKKTSYTVTDLDYGKTYNFRVKAYKTAGDKNVYSGHKTVKVTTLYPAVYVTPSGKRYHYDRECAGKNATKTTLANAKKTKTPCKTCVL